LEKTRRTGWWGGGKEEGARDRGTQNAGMRQRETNTSVSRVTGGVQGGKFSPGHEHRAELQNASGQKRNLRSKRSKGKKVEKSCKTEEKKKKQSLPDLTDNPSGRGGKRQLRGGLWLGINQKNGVTGTKPGPVNVENSWWQIGGNRTHLKDVELPEWDSSCPKEGEGRAKLTGLRDI